MVFSRHDELCKDHGSFAVERSVTDVVLPCSAMRGVKDEVTALLVVGSRGGDRGNVRTVTSFGHREAARCLQRHDARQPLLVVFVSAKVCDRCAEEAPLDSRLNLQGRVSQHELLKVGDIAAGVVFAAYRFGER